MSRDHVMGLMKSLKFVAIPKAYDEVLAKIGRASCRERV